MMTKEKCLSSLWSEASEMPENFSIRSHSDRTESGAIIRISRNLRHLN